MTHGFHLPIDGAARAGSSGEAGAVVDPATGEAIGEVACASAGDVAEAVAAAARGLRRRSATPPWERQVSLR